LIRYYDGRIDIEILQIYFSLSNVERRQHECCGKQICLMFYLIHRKCNHWRYTNSM